jgi:hypothetical protein
MNKKIKLKLKAPLPTKERRGKKGKKICGVRRKPTKTGKGPR